MLMCTLTFFTNHSERVKRLYLFKEKKSNVFLTEK